LQLSLLIDESTNDNNLETSEYVEESHPNDPFEGFNRAMWDINYEYLDPYLVRPVSLAYVGYTPVPVRSGISNFLANLDEPASMVNNLFMGNGEKALDHFNRFWINSTFGLLALSMLIQILISTVLQHQAAPLHLQILAISLIVQ